MPWDARRYPWNWKAIRHRILLRAGYRCECTGECGLHHDRRCAEKNGTVARWARGKIVLTIAHLAQPIEDVRDENLKAMCQRCHLRYDVELHAANAAETRRRKAAERAGAVA